MNELDFALQTKELNDEGFIEGLAAGYGNLDFGGDVLLPGALGKSLEGRSSLPMLLYHDHKRPAGVWTDFKELPEGLLVKGRFSMSTTAGKEAHSLVKDGALAGLSIGYGDTKAKMVGRARHISSAFLHEVSLVTVPMNAKTRVVKIKDIVDSGSMPTVREFENFLRDAGGFSKTKAAAIASASAMHLQGEPENVDTFQLVELAKALGIQF